MEMELLTHWNLRERPFEATWDVRFFYQSSEHQEALDRLGFLVEEQTMNMGMLTGEIGCGKTLTRAVFVSRLHPTRYVVFTQENSAFSFNDLLGWVLQSLDPTGRGQGKFARYDRFKKAIEKLHAEGRHIVLVFDEAQEMSPASLSELKLLTNLNGGGKTLLTIILLGQPELRSVVAKLPAIDQRISLRFHLGALNISDTAAYVAHRLKMAGHPTGELFSTDAVARLHQACRGIPRELNRLAKLSLEYAWLREAACVEEMAVDMVIRDLSKHQTLCAA
jgi:general secretion pathway protein A